MTHRRVYGHDADPGPCKGSTQLQDCCCCNRRPPRVMVRSIFQHGLQLTMDCQQVPREPIMLLVKSGFAIQTACSRTRQLLPHMRHPCTSLPLTAAAIAIQQALQTQHCSATNLLEVFAWASDTTTAFATGPNCAKAASKACSGPKNHNAQSSGYETGPLQNVIGLHCPVSVHIIRSARAGSTLHQTQCLQSRSPFRL